MQVLTKVKMGWGEMPKRSAETEVRVVMKTGLEGMTLGELLYWALMGEEAGVRG